MSEKIEEILKDAASNVACESKEEVSKETLESMKNQLLGMSEKSDDSFIYGLYKSVMKEEKNERKRSR